MLTEWRDLSFYEFSIFKAIYVKMTKVMKESLLLLHIFQKQLPPLLQPTTKKAVTDRIFWGLSLVEIKI